MLDPKERERVEFVLKYIEDGDLRWWSLPDSKAFNVGIREWRSKLNCITNPRIYEQVQVCRCSNYCQVKISLCFSFLGCSETSES